MKDETLTPVPMDNGEVVLVRPLSPFAHMALLEQARAEFPLPDPEPYRRPLPNALNPDDKEPADLNPEYVSDRDKALRLQNNFFLNAVIRAGVIEAVEGETQQATLERYTAALARKRAAIQRLPDDEWLACVMVCLMTTVDDIRRVAEFGSGALSKEEIARAMDAFRSDIQRRRAVTGAGKEVTPSTEGKQEPG